MNIFDIITPDAIFICVFITVLFAIGIMVVCCKCGNISFKQDLIASDVNDTKELVSNVVQGSKRIERNVDAINQRTRAEKNRKKQVTEKRGASYDGKTSKNKTQYKKNNKTDRNKYNSSHNN